MSLLLAPDHWPERCAAADGPLAALAAGLAQELEPLLASDVYIPREKAVLSREGGRCAADGAFLEFDPFRPHEHRCPTCGRVYRGELHDRFWLYWYQLWIAERAVHGALLHRLRGDERHAVLAETILSGYADRYLEYPNRDNVLGPTRVFFSTYIESIWLLQLCIALDLLESAGRASVAGVVRDRVVEPSAELIAIYNEGISNRQAWNNAALMAAGVVLGRPAAAEQTIGGSGGLLTHLSRALLPDGTWYEGENYHLFAHRGLWYCVTIAERLGAALPPPLVARFQEGFATPFLTALPDLTLVSRRDSQYAISLRQVRFAELCELGIARSGDDRLAEMLHTLYAPGVPRAETGRWRSTADVERNLSPSGLSRADLGWRALLHALPTLPRSRGTGPRSVVLEGQGIAVLRRERGQIYVALDYGHSGGGHGHPDRLNLLLCHGPVRWLDDMGTGSYVERTLFWYRSTLAHNAPLVDGRSQERVHGRLLAYEERGAAGWVEAVVDGIAPDVRVRRTVVVMPDYLVDEVSWEGLPDGKTIDLPFHVDGDLRGGSAWSNATLPGGRAPEDGFEFARDTQVSESHAGQLMCLSAAAGGEQLEAWLQADRPSQWWRALAPGAPGTGERRFHLARLRGATGALRSVWSWTGAVASVSLDAERTQVTVADGARHEHSRRGDCWHVELLSSGARSSIDLDGMRDQPPPPPAAVGMYGDATTAPRATRVEPIVLARAGSPVGEWLTDAAEHGKGGFRAFSLGETHYRRSEESWREAGEPRATLILAWTGTDLHVEVDVEKPGELSFVPTTAVNRYDNELPDINGDGIQLYLRAPQSSGAWVLVPELPDTAVRVRAVPGWGDHAPPRAKWRRTKRGYAMHVVVALCDSPPDRALPVALDAIVNESAPPRERRRGQLVLSGAAGEFVYLAGDRHDPDRLLSFALAG